MMNIQNIGEIVIVMMTKVVQEATVRKNRGKEGVRAADQKKENIRKDIVLLEAKVPV